MSAEVAQAPVAGFWIRLLAQLVDACVWGFTTSLLGWALVFVAPNTFGMASAFFQYRLCRQLDGPPPAIRPPPELSPNAAFHCSKSFLGLPFRDEVVLVEVQRTGTGTTTQKSVTAVVGPDLKPKRVLDLDWLFWLAFIGYLVFAQGTAGATMGKRMLRLCVVGPDGEPPGLRAAVVRNLVLNGPWLFALVVLFAAGVSGTFFTGMSIWFPFVIAVLLVQLALWAQVWFTASNGTPSIHDRIAGTRVVRLPQPDDELGLPRSP